MHKVLSWKITGLFQNFRYFSKFTVAVRTCTIVIIPVRYLSLRTLVTTHNPAGRNWQGECVALLMSRLEHLSRILFNR